MALVDTCGWIEWLTNGMLADKYEPYFDTVELLIVPTSVQFELYKWVTSSGSHCSNRAGKSSPFVHINRFVSR